MCWCGACGRLHHNCCRCLHAQHHWVLECTQVNESTISTQFGHLVYSNCPNVNFSHQSAARNFQVILKEKFIYLVYTHTLRGSQSHTVYIHKHTSQNTRIYTVMSILRTLPSSSTHTHTHLFLLAGGHLLWRRRYLENGLSSGTGHEEIFFAGLRLTKLFNPTTILSCLQ